MTPVGFRAQWLASRARNAVRRKTLVVGVAAGVFVTALVGFAVMPQGPRRVRPLPPPVVSVIDTAILVEAVALGQRRIVAADSALSIGRDRARVAAAAAAAAAATAARAVPDTTAVARRDSLTTALNDLQSGLATAQTVPLPSSYRALAALPGLIGNGRVRALIDTLGALERERDAVGASGGADPIFVALTSKVTDVGRAIEAEAVTLRDSLRARLTSVAAGPVSRRALTRPVVDTAQWLAERDSARSALTVAIASLSEARDKNAQRLREAEHTNALAAAIAPPLAFLGAAIVFGLVLGFGVSLAGELRRPRVADPRDAERSAGLHVVATIQPRPPDPERQRRGVDRELPWFVDPLAGAYQQIYQRIARDGASHVVATVAAADPSLAAVITLNLAAVAAGEARTVLVIDANGPAAPLSAALGIGRGLGLADVVTGRTAWSAATVPSLLGRDRVVDVVPAGGGAIDVRELVARLRDDCQRLGRHYDAIFVATSFDAAADGVPLVMPQSNTVVCVRSGATKLDLVRDRVHALRTAGVNLIGTVVWEGELPELLVHTSAQETPRRPGGGSAAAQSPKREAAVPAS
jgi:Mrp family chromosome partitioning ATPase